jgi:hypothetical protein
MKNNRFVLPGQKSSLIAELHDGTIDEYGHLDIPFSSKSIITENNLIVSLCFGNKPKKRRLRIFDINGKQLYRNNDYKYDSIAVKKNVVYLGGQYRKHENELFSYLDLTNIDFSINELKLPIETIAGKSIDDILIYDNDLYLVDDIFFPKYIFKYDISQGNSPKHISTKELENNGTYEHIIKGDITENYMILFSSTVGRGGAYEHIVIDGKIRKKIAFCIESFRNSKKECGKIYDLCLLGDKIIIVNKNIIGIFEIEKHNEYSEITIAKSNDKQYVRVIKVNDNSCVLTNGCEYEILSV